jgi:hypothetical protein
VETSVLTKTFPPHVALFRLRREIEVLLINRRITTTTKNNTASTMPATAPFDNPVDDAAPVDFPAVVEVVAGEGSDVGREAGAVGAG